MEKETEKQNLGSGSIPGLMIKLAVPTIIAQLVNLLYNLVDRIYIGHIREVGDIALTGLGLCFPVLMMVTAFAMLIGSGGAPRAAIYMGKGDSGAYSWKQCDKPNRNLGCADHLSGSSRGADSVDVWRE